MPSQIGSLGFPLLKLLESFAGFFWCRRRKRSLLGFVVVAGLGGGRDGRGSKGVVSDGCWNKGCHRRFSRPFRRKSRGLCGHIEGIRRGRVERSGILISFLSSDPTASCGSLHACCPCNPFNELLL